MGKIKNTFKATGKFTPILKCKHGVGLGLCDELECLIKIIKVTYCVGPGVGEHSVSFSSAGGGGGAELDSWVEDQLIKRKEKDIFAWEGAD